MTAAAEVLNEIETTFARLAKSVKKIATSNDWVSQLDSPLGKRMHLALVRTGELPGSKVGKLVLVRRTDLDAYIEKHRVRVASAEEREDEQRTIEELARPKARTDKRRRTV